MPGPQVEKLVERIVQALPRYGSLEAAIDAVQQELEVLSPGLASGLGSEIGEAREIVSRQFERIEILHTHSVIRKRPQWYFGRSPADLHWPAVHGFLLNQKQWPVADVDGIDEASTEVVSLLENPRSRDRPQFSCRGLVVGHVQSGKTANMTAVIAKALDSGYDTVIVLAGLTNKLRKQTQDRLFEDLVLRNPMNWQVLTPNEVDRDFRAPPQGGFLSHSDKAQLAVIKKNVSPLRELKNAIERTLPAVLARLRILVIDDECDQASVNSARGELDMTVINQRIREILSILPAVTYVGYTATPFANVLINPYRGDGQDLDDLYPRDFITALPKSDRYFGAERLFGRVPVDPANLRPDEEGLDMIRSVPTNEESLLQPRNRRERASFQPSMTPTLQAASLYVLACCAARCARGDAGKHMSMLVHTSAYVAAHERVAEMIETWVESHRADFVVRDSALGQEIETIWTSEHARMPSDITDAPRVSVEEVFLHLSGVLERMEFPVENGASDDRIDYSGPPRTYIVVGGSILARGLTLEGLMVSYFLRTANQYDTLLQMGRWFGYRPRYEDLPRIWMPEALKLRFRSLASVEQEVRDDIDQFRLQEQTPMEIAVRIRAIPGMAITAANKMRAARRCAVSYWGTHRQTFRFSHRDNDVLVQNWSEGVALVRSAEALGVRDGQAIDRKLWRGVPKWVIRRFLERYAIERTHVDLQQEMLLPFLDDGDPRLALWNVGVVESGSGSESELELGAAGRVRMVRRAKLIDGGSVADIKALMSKSDLLFDCNGIAADGSWDELKRLRQEELGQIPMLLLYPIDRVSEPRPPNPGRPPVREPLNALRDILGFGLVFPGSVAEGGNFVSVELHPISAEEIAEIEDEEAAQAEAAGVR